jgi:hypothetical protein
VGEYVIAVESGIPVAGQLVKTNLKVKNDKHLGHVSKFLVDGAR